MPCLAVIQHPVRLELRLVRKSHSYSQVQASIFQEQSATKDEIAAAGERAMIIIHKGGKTDSLNSLWLKCFLTESIRLSTLTIYHQHLCLPCFAASECTIRFRNGWEIHGRLMPHSHPSQPGPCSSIRVGACVLQLQVRLGHYMLQMPSSRT